MNTTIFLFFILGGSPVSTDVRLVKFDTMAACEITRQRLFSDEPQMMERSFCASVSVEDKVIVPVPETISVPVEAAPKKCVWRDRSGQGIECPWVIYLYK